VQAELPGGRIPMLPHRKRRADYVLELTPGLPLMVVEAKRSWAHPTHGIQQATRYATKLGIPLPLSTNGTGCAVRRDHGPAAGHRRRTDTGRGLGSVGAGRRLVALAKEYLRASFSRTLLTADGSVKELRYYQQRAIHEVLCSIAARLCATANA